MRYYRKYARIFKRHFNVVRLLLAPVWNEIGYLCTDCQKGMRCCVSNALIHSWSDSYGIG